MTKTTFWVTTVIAVLLGITVGVELAQTNHPQPPPAAVTTP